MFNVNNPIEYSRKDKITTFRKKQGNRMSKYLLGFAAIILSTQSLLGVEDDISNPERKQAIQRTMNMLDKGIQTTDKLQTFFSLISIGLPYFGGDDYVNGTANGKHMLELSSGLGKVVFGLVGAYQAEDDKEQKEHLTKSFRGLTELFSFYIAREDEKIRELIENEKKEKEELEKYKKEKERELIIETKKIEEKIEVFKKDILFSEKKIEELRCEIKITEEQGESDRFVVVLKKFLDEEQDQYLKKRMLLTESETETKILNENMQNLTKKINEFDINISLKKNRSEKLEKCILFSRFSGIFVEKLSKQENLWDIKSNGNLLKSVMEELAKTDFSSVVKYGSEILCYFNVHFNYFPSLTRITQEISGNQGEREEERVK